MEAPGFSAACWKWGASGIYTGETAFGMALREAVYAAQAARLCGRPALPAGELGLYGYLFPMSENPFICQRCRHVMARIRSYDAQNHTNLEHTARVYVAQNLDVASAAPAALSASQYGSLPFGENSKDHEDGRRCFF